MRVDSRIGRGFAVAVGTTAAVAALGACSSGNSSSSSSTSASATGSSSSSSTATSNPTNSGASCTSESLLSALPNGAKMVSFHCGSTGNGQIAGVKVNPGPTVFFLETKDGKWVVINSDRVCGTASAGLPPAVLAYCTAPKSASASSPS